VKGLEGKYFKSPDLSGDPVATRVDPVLNFGPFNASNLPDPSIVPPFSGIWTGTITPKISGDHLFKVSTGGNVQLFVNGQKILDKLFDCRHARHAGLRFSALCARIRQDQATSRSPGYY
jgi:beta-glucosidase